MSGGVEGLFLVISHTFPIYKQLSTQGTITSCSLNKLDVKNHWVLRDLENPQALSSALAALRRYSPGPSSFLNPVEPWFLTSNYYVKFLIFPYNCLLMFQYSVELPWNTSKLHHLLCVNFELSSVKGCTSYE